MSLRVVKDVIMNRQKANNLSGWWMRIVVHLACAVPLMWLVFAIPAGELGGDPVKELIHFLGIGALRILLLTLAIYPLVKFFSFKKLNRLRRPLGLWCFAWASLHFCAWLYLDLALQWQLISQEVVKRSYIAVGFLAWVILFVLAVTSIPFLVRKLGKHWKKIHSLVYLVLVLTCLHFLWAVKSGWIEPVSYALIGAILLISRWRKIRSLVGF